MYESVVQKSVVQRKKFVCLEWVATEEDHDPEQAHHPPGDPRGS
jgi:hypothetical protein